MIFLCRYRPGIWYQLHYIWNLINITPNLSTSCFNKNSTKDSEASQTISKQLSHNNRKTKLHDRRSLLRYPAGCFFLRSLLPPPPGQHNKNFQSSSCVVFSSSNVLIKGGCSSSYGGGLYVGCLFCMCGFPQL